MGSQKVGQTQIGRIYQYWWMIERHRRKTLQLIPCPWKSCFEEERPGELSRNPPRKFGGDEKQETFQRTIWKVSRTLELRRGVELDSFIT